MKPIIMQRVKQPFSEFYIGHLKSDVIYENSQINRRKDDSSLGVQRSLVESRIENIEIFSKDPDAIFPTPIILSANSDFVEIEPIKDGKYKDHGLHTLEFKEKLLKDNGDSLPFNILDGQHRMIGIHRSNEIFDLPVVIIVDPDIHEQAYVFSTINSNQRQVSKSLIFDLFSYDPSDKRSVEKTCHFITKSLDELKSSPLHNKIKMLGVNVENKQNATLSQGTVASKILSYITSNSQKDNLALKNDSELTDLDNSRYIFRRFFINNNDEIIIKVLINYFSAIKSNFNDEWINHDEFVLTRSIGFSAMMRLLQSIFNYCLKSNDLSFEKFDNIFFEIKEHSNTLNENDENKIKLTTTGYSESVARDISKQFYNIFENIFLNS